MKIERTLYGYSCHGPQFPFPIHDKTRIGCISTYLNIISDPDAYSESFTEANHKYEQDSKLGII